MNKDIIISGGGIAGLVLAILLANKGKNVALIEPHAPKPLSKTKPSGRSLALLSSSLDLIKQTGAWDGCEKFAQDIEGFCLIDDSINGRSPVRANCPAKSALQFSDFACNVPNSILRAALWGQAEKTDGLEIIEGASYQSHKSDDDFVAVSLDDARSITARLLVGLDGRNSPVRDNAGLKMHPHDIRQSALTCLISHTLPHNNVASEIHRIGGLLALVPCPDNTSNVVWLDSPDNLPKENVKEELQKASLDILGEITQISEVQTWPMASAKACRITAPRVAIMAEAAHIFPPTGAQGLNLSLRDVELLANLAGQADDAGAPCVLRRYGRKRALDIASCVAIVSAANSLIRARPMPVRIARRSFLKLTNRFKR